MQQARVANALEPEWEARFEPRSYGFRPGRGCHDAIESIYWTLKGRLSKRQWVLDADLSAAFDRIDHQRLLAHLGSFPGRGMIAGWLAAGVIEQGRFAPTEEGTPQGGVVTPPTQLRTWVCLLVGVVICGLLGRGGRAATAGWDGVADRDASGADEDVFDQQPQHALLLADGGGGGVAA
ncbi:MAG: reverse transcriptase/maturase family protein [Nocardioidaceae bacterium]